MYKICAVILAAVALTSAQSQYITKASIYANTGGTGAFINLPTNQYVSDLGTYGFDNRAYSVCLTGT